MNKDKSIGKNSAFYLLYTTLNVAFPFFTGIYVARILSPDAVGEVSYALNIVSYFVTFAFLGIPTYGLREVAKNRNDKGPLNRLFSELIIINGVSTTIWILIYIGVVVLIPKFRNSYLLYLITGSLVLFNYLNISWLYEGLEEFKFISIRNLCFKFVSLFLLVMLVKKPDDLLWYAGVTVIGSAGNNSINVLYARKYVKFTTKGLNFARHLKPIFYLVFVNLAIELYSLVDVTMLGWIKDNASVAFYSYGNNINRILLQVINTFTIVVIPRLSSYYKEKRYGDFNELISKTFCLLLLFSLPMIVGIYFTSRNIIVLLYGERYVVSSSILKILSLNLLVSPIGYLLGSRVCLVVGKERKMLITVAIGALVNVIGNAFLIRVLGCTGAAVASVASEITMMVIYILQSREYFKLVNIKEEVAKILAASFSMSVLLAFINLIEFDLQSKILVCVASAIVCYFGVLAALKETIVTLIVNKIRERG